MHAEITAADYESKVLKHKGLVIVDFYSQECSPCEALAPKFEFFAELYHKEVAFYKIFRQGDREHSRALGVKSSPSLLFYKDGKEVAPRLTGAIKKSEIKQTIVDAFGLPDRTLGIMRKTEEVDLAIIGGGPAGLTAGIYAGRAKINTVIIDQGNPGGQVNLTHMVANYPGTDGEIGGFALMEKVTKQAEESGARIIRSAEIVRLDLAKKEIDVDDDRRIHAKAIILATGAKPRELGIPGEKSLFGRGISYCATCDGRFYEGKDIFVIGGGNSAVEETLFLTEFVNSVTMVHQFDEFQANKTAAEQALKNPKIKVLWSHEPRAFHGNEGFEGLEVENLKTGERKVLTTGAGVFVFVGYVPQTQLFAEQLPLDRWGGADADPMTLETKIPGVFIAGDLRSKPFKQITTAVSDGTVAALSAQKYLRSLGG
ncbi:MAG TPA: FAD-dependent oxidoreductase [Rectinemataceae bacterium]|nr:FAD-dependent oxidoreductase [Rectinemataceae bacterium]